MKENIDKILYKLFILGTALMITFGAIDQFIWENNIFKIDKVIVSGCNLVDQKSIENQFSFIQNVCLENFPNLTLKIDAVCNSPKLSQTPFKRFVTQRFYQ